MDIIIDGKPFQVDATALRALLVSARHNLMRLQSLGEFTSAERKALAFINDVQYDMPELQ